MLKRGLAKFIFLTFLFTMPFASAFITCDATAGRTVLTKDDFYHQLGSIAKVVVFGEAQAKSGTEFSDNTTVLLDCNVDGTFPEALDKNPKARIIGYTQSTLSYTGDCYYSRPKVDTSYQVGATIMPDNQPCVPAVDFSKVKIIGSGEDVKPVLKESCGGLNEKVCEGNKCNDPYVYDGYNKCAACPAGTEYKDGKCATTQEPEEPVRKKKQLEPDPEPSAEEDDIIKLDLTDADFTIKLKKGKNFISIPFEDAEFVGDTCKDAKYYSYVKKRNAFVKSDLDTILSSKDNYVGKGVLVKVNEECEIGFDGDFSSSQELSLTKGWNFIGVQSEAFQDHDSIESDCKFSSSILSFSEAKKKYSKEKILNPGIGYLVKVKKACAISASTEDEPDLGSLDE